MGNSPSLTQLAYDRIRQDILTCTLEPGTHVVQREFAEAYGLGKTPVHNALEKLAQDGLLQAIPRFGYRISPITLGDVRELFEMRLIIEVEVAGLAAMRASAEDIERIVELASFTYKHGRKETYQAFLAFNTDFHRLIAVSAGNRRLVASVVSVLEELTRVFHLGLDLKDSAEEMRDDHVAIANAISNHDPSAAKDLARGEITRSQDRVMQALACIPARELGLQRTVQIAHA